MCRENKLEQATLSRFDRLLVQSGSGATETAFYEDPETHGPNALIFQWVFVEEGLATPDQDDIAMGIRCWADPDTSGCEERMP